jgi:hypothetical protein
MTKQSAKSRPKLNTLRVTIEYGRRGVEKPKVVYDEGGLTDGMARERFHEILKAFGTAIPTPAKLDATPPKRPALRCLD